LFPYAITNPRATRIDGSTNGTRVSALRIDFPLNLYRAMRKERGRARKMETIVLAVACKRVNPKMPL